MPRLCTETPGSTQAEALPEVAEPLRDGVWRRLLRTFRSALLFWLRARESASSPSRIRSSGRSARGTADECGGQAHRAEHHDVCRTPAGRPRQPMHRAFGRTGWAEPKGEALS